MEYYNVEKSINSIPEATKSVTDTAVEITSALGGLFDISPNTSSCDSPEDAEFRRQMQRKKKKRSFRI